MTDTLPAPALFVVITLVARADPVPFGFTTSKRTVYAEFLVAPDRVRVNVMPVPRLTGTFGLIESEYEAAPETRGACARIRVSAKATRGVTVRSLII